MTSSFLPPSSAPGATAPSAPDPEIGRVSRRRVLQGFVIGAGAIALAACSGTTSASDNGGATGTAPGTTPGTTEVRIPTVAGTAKAPVLLGNPVTNKAIEPGTRPDPSRPEGTDLLPQIEHIVVLMMENHSFDNYFGMLGRGDGLTLGPDGRPTNSNPDADGQPVVAYHLPTTSQKENKVSQNWTSSHKQLDGGKLDGFVTTSGKQSMGYWTADDLPFYHSLAKQFPICDRYFCSVLAQTYPNRRYAQAATSRGNVSTTLPKLDEPPPPNGTIFDLLDKHNVSWRNYTVTLPELALYPSVYLSHQDKVSKADKFLADAKAGTLPAYSVVTPHNDVSEENPQDIKQGEAFSAAIINAVLESPNWDKTVLIFTYDEHGGYYDHVEPPKAFAPDDVPPDPAKTNGTPGGFDQLGFRVPTVIVSPFARQDYVSHVTHDHTSILRLVETKWNLGAMTYRDANASNLLDALDLDGPPAFATPPKLAASTMPANAMPVPPPKDPADAS